MMKGLTAFLTHKGRAPALLLGLAVSTMCQSASADTILNITGNIKA